MRAQPSRVDVTDGLKVEAAPEGWWYSTPLVDGSCVAIFFTDADLLPIGTIRRSALILNQLRHCPMTREACPPAEDLVQRHQWRGFDARTGLRRLILSHGWVAAGD